MTKDIQSSGFPTGLQAICIRHTREIRVMIWCTSMLQTIKAVRLSQAKGQVEHTKRIPYNNTSNSAYAGAQLNHF